MAQYYLRLEAVNLGNFVYDTNNLSMVRGGGLLLLNAVDRVAKEIDSVQLTPLMTGASTGLYTFEADGSATAEQVRRAIVSYLDSDPQLKHATFVVDVQPSHGESQFHADHETVIAKNRWRQMQSPSVAVPAGNTDSSVKACRIDGVRPGTVDRPGPGNKAGKASESASIRLDYGREQKQAFYREQSGTSVTALFTNDLNELTNDPKQGNLNHKMAVIYLDGNKFGAVKKVGNAGLSRQKDFDDTLKEYRRLLLQKLLDRIAADDQWKTPKTPKTPDGQYRIETLLWGGDEIIWVVPAWKGWEALSFFFHESRKWSFKETERLHHAGGMVLCHHNAPIYRITALARELAELAKDEDRERSLFAYEVLESFDHIGRDLGGYRKERCPQPLNPDGEPDQSVLILAGDDMPDVLDAARLLKESMPRRQLHAMVDHLLTKTKTRSADEAATRRTERKELVGKLRSDLKNQDQQSALSTLTSKLGGDDALWLHLAALWDYLA